MCIWNSECIPMLLLKLPQLQQIIKWESLNSSKKTTMVFFLFHSNDSLKRVLNRKKRKIFGVCQHDRISEILKCFQTERLINKKRSTKHVLVCKLQMYVENMVPIVFQTLANHEVLRKVAVLSPLNINTPHKYVAQDPLHSFLQPCGVCKQTNLNTVPPFSRFEFEKTKFKKISTSYDWSKIQRISNFSWCLRE